jgi:hypothetical protein
MGVRGGSARAAYLAGQGIFAAANWIHVHSGIGWLLALVSIGMLLLVFMSRQPRQVVLLNMLVFALMFVQVGLVSFFRAFRINELTALHPLNAMLLFGAAAMLALRASRR